MRRGLSLAVRIAVTVGLLVFVFSRIPLWDQVKLADGTVLEGRLREEGPMLRLALRSGGERSVPAAELASGGKDAVVHGILPVFSSIRWRWVVPGFLWMGSLFVWGAWRWRKLLAAVGYAIPLRSALELTLIGQFLSVFLPGTNTGDVFKAIFVSRGQAERTKPVFSVIVDRIMGILGLLTLTLVAVAFKADDPRFRSVGLAVLAAGLAAASGAAFLLSRRVRALIRWERLAPRLPFAGVVSRLDEALLQYRQSLRTLGSCLAISVGIHVGIVGGIWALAQALSVEGAAAGDFFVLVPIINSIKAVPISPSGLGVGEVSFQALFGLVGTPPAQAVALSLLVTTCYLAWGLTGGIFLLLARHQVELKSSV